MPRSSKNVDQTKTYSWKRALTVFFIVVLLLFVLGGIWLKSYLRGEIIQALQEEVRESCSGCTLEFDSLRVSPFLLRAQAKEVRIVEHGRVGLRFSTIRARIGFAPLLGRVIQIKHLSLIEGEAFGVLEKSVTYRFIDHLATPKERSPSKSKPLFTVRLEKLTISDSQFSEKIASSDLLGRHLSMLMTRDQNDDFVLQPRVKDLRVRKKGSTKESDDIRLGGLGTRLTLTKAKAFFTRLRLKRGQNLIKGAMTSNSREGNKLEGDLLTKIDSSYILLSSWLQSSFEGSFDVGGTLGSPVFTGELHESEDKDAIIHLAGYPLFSFDTLQAKVQYSLKEKISLLEVAEMEAKSNQNTARLIRPITLIDDKLSGAVQLEVESVTYGPFQATNTSALLDLGGALDRVVLNLSGNMENLMLGSYSTERCNFRLKLEGPEVSFSLNRFEEGSSALKVDGVLTQPEGSEWNLDALNFQFKELPLFPVSENLTTPIRVDGAGKLHGALDLARLNGSGTLQLSSRNFAGESALSGDFELQNGTFKTKVSNRSKSLAAALSLGLSQKESVLSLSLDEFKPEEYDPKLKCVTVSLSGTYHFTLTEPMSGNGDINLTEAHAGCAPYQTALSHPVVLGIRSGRAEINDVLFEGTGTQLNLDGSFSLNSPMRITATGAIEMNSLLPFVPAVDDLRGVVDVALTLEGTITEPEYSGRLQVQNTEVALEAANIQARQIGGMITLGRGGAKIHSITGKLNGGDLGLSGELSQLSTDRSHVELTFENVLIEPVTNATVTASGIAILSRDPGEELHLEGDVYIDNAELRKDLDLSLLLETVVNSLAGSDPEAPIAPTLPAIELDLKLNADNNLFFLSNLLEAELSANLEVTGTLNKPQVKGRLLTLSGWTGVKDRRFDITSGEIIFTRANRTPRIDLVGETTLYTRQGGSHYVIVEATGNIVNPDLKFSSDTGLSQQEIISLLTSSQTYGSTNSSFSRRDQSLLRKLRILDDEPTTALGRFLDRIATIDSLSVEPIFNIRTGVTEPAIVAEKSLATDIRLEGESFLSGTGSLLTLAYDLNDRMQLSGSANTVVSENNTAFEANVSYTVLSKSKNFLDITVEGNRNINDQDLLLNLRLTKNSRIPLQDTSKILQRVREFYEEHGFFSPIIRMETSDDREYLRELKLEIDEGHLSQVKEVRFLGENLPHTLPDSLEEKSIRNRLIDGDASSHFKSRATNRLLRALRSEGYIGARVNSSYEPIPESNDRALVFDLSLGKPVSFSFVGNDAFSPRDFLGTINLFSRRQPFGNNTIHILVENIEQLYREAGYLFASVDYDRILDEKNQRIQYRVFIQEENVVPVKEVVLEGGATFSREEVLRLVTDLFGAGRTEEIFDPKFALDESIAESAKVLQALYEDQGFPDCNVQYEILPSEDGQSVTIKYGIAEGEPLQADWIIVQGGPPGLSLPTPPEAPYSIPRANHYLNVLIDELVAAGYQSPGISSQFDVDVYQLIVDIDAGALTTIESLIIPDDIEIDHQVVKKALTVKAGDSWDQNALAESRRNLLRTGLFTRVSLEPLDGNLDSEKEVLLLSLTVKPLQTLELGAGANSEFGIHLFGEAIDRALFKDGKTLSLRLDTYYDRTAAEVSQGIVALRFNNPHFFDSAYRFHQDARFQRLDLSTLDFDLDRTVLESTIYRSFHSGFSLSWTYTLLHENLDDVKEDVILGRFDTGMNTLGIFGGTVGYDLRDNPLNPEDGMNFGFEYGVSDTALLSDATYWFLGSRISALKPLGTSRYSLANNFRVRSAWTYGDTETIPISQRFFLGGRNTVRGFRENSLGPRGKDGGIIGGDLSLLNNIELRRSMTESIQSLLFCDIGGLYLQEESISASALRIGTGVGVRYLSPLGPIGIDVGTPIDEREGEPSLRLHFRIGSMF